MLTKTSILLFTLTSVFIAPVALADDADRPGTLFGVKAGLFSPGTVDTDSSSDDAYVSYSAGLFVDRALTKDLYGGISLDVGNVDAFDDTTTLVDLSLNLKARFSPGSRWSIVPGFGLGYGIADDAEFFIVKASVEFLIPSDGGPTWMLEAAVLGAPSGGNSDTDITFGPGFMLRGGVAF
jgi:hypothetical protein